MRRRPLRLALLLAPLLLATLTWVFAPWDDARANPEAEPEPGPESPVVDVPKGSVAFDDGDSVTIRWVDRVEVVRILGIDTPEVQHLEHDLPYAQPFGEQAAGFLQGCIAVCDRIQILRAATKDPYGRTLAYLYLDGKNYSALVVQAGLAVSNVDYYGDNGLPGPAADVEVAAKRAGPVPFEKPHLYRARMRKVTAWMKEQGTYPEHAGDEEER